MVINGYFNFTPNKINPRKQQVPFPFFTTHVVRQKYFSMETSFVDLLNTGGGVWKSLIPTTRNTGSIPRVYL